MHSSTFREAKRYQKDSSSWCGGCKLEKHNRQQAAIKATVEVYVMLRAIGFLFLMWLLLFLQVLKRRGAEKAHVELSSKSTAH